MAGKLEKSKGKVKQVVGTLTDNKKLESEGKIDRRAGEAQEEIGRAKRKAERVVEDTRRLAGTAIDRARDAARRK